MSKYFVRHFEFVTRRGSNREKLNGNKKNKNEE